MRLTMIHRDAIVDSAMNDVPQVDYEQKFRDEALKLAVSRLPADVLTIWKKYGGDAVHMDTMYVDMCGVSFLKLPYIKGKGTEIFEAVKRAAAGDHQAYRAQLKSREELGAKLKGALAGITTLKQLQARLPELVKYAPEEVAKSDNLPALANVMTDLMKAGWPKPAQQAVAPV